MSAPVTVTAAPRGPRLADPLWKATAVAGIAQLAGLAIALSGSGGPATSLSVALVGVVIAAFVLAPLTAATLHRHPALLVVAGLLVVGVLWLVLGVAGFGLRLQLDSVPGLGALWGLARGSMFTFALMSLAATGGLVLIADALRVRAAQTRRRGAPWQQMTSIAPAARAPVPWRAVAGVLLVGWAAVLAIGIAAPYAGGSGLAQVMLMVVIVGAVAVVIGTPLLISSLTRVDRDQAVGAREDERQRFAAHLHDSVLQTLALVQRQAHDPAAVTRLARRQEHALRAWMAGETELLSETLVAALRDVVAEVEDEQDITVEMTAIGDRPLDPAGEALAAAAREALRNAARHAGGAAIVVFAELTPMRVEVFIRDEGPGFDQDTVASERRGIRDAIVGRMAAAGGHAAIESAPGEGTEVALRLGMPAPTGRPRSSG